MIAKILKYLGVITGIIVVLLILFWPVEQAMPDDGRIHLKYWYVTGQKEELPYSVRRFNAIQDSIVVEATAIPWQESEKKILTAILSGDPPDVIDQFVPAVKWASRLALCPLDGFIRRDRFDTSLIFPALMEEMRWQGHIFAIPTATASFGLYYNRRLFRQAGLDPDSPPTTWQQVRDMNSRLTEYDEQGRLIQLGYLFYLGRSLKVSQQAEETITLMAFQKNIPFMNGAGDSVVFATSEMADIIHWIMAARNQVPSHELQAFTAGFGYGDQHAFVSEKVAMMVLGSNFVDNIARYHPHLDYAVARVPSFQGYPTASTAGSWWMAIPRGSKNKAAAWQFIKFSAGRESQTGSILATKESLYPTNRLAARDPRFLRTAADSVFLFQMNHSHSPAIVPMAHDVFWREFIGATEKAVYGLMEPLAALQQAQTIVQSELDAALEYDAYVRRHMSLEVLK